MAAPDTPPTSLSEALHADGKPVLDLGELTGTQPGHGIIVTLPDEMGGGQLWTRFDNGEAKVDWRPSRWGGSWSLGRFHGLTAEVAP